MQMYVSEVIAGKEENEHGDNPNQWLLSIRKIASLCRRWRVIVLGCKRLFQDTSKPWNSDDVGHWGMTLPDSTIQFDMNCDTENDRMQARSLVKEGFMRYAKCLSIDSFADIGDLQSGFNCLVRYRL